jgi:hypothetical protein
LKQTCEVVLFYSTKTQNEAAPGHHTVSAEALRLQKPQGFSCCLVCMSSLVL